MKKSNFLFTIHFSLLTIFFLLTTLTSCKSYVFLSIGGKVLTNRLINIKIEPDELGNRGNPGLKGQAVDLKAILYVDIKLEGAELPAPIIINDIQAPYGKTLIVAKAVPMGYARVITVTGKTGPGNVPQVAGAEWKSAFHLLQMGDTTIMVNNETTPAGQVIDHLINDGNGTGNDTIWEGIASKLDLNALNTFIQDLSTYAPNSPHTSGKHPTFVNTQAIADDLKTNSGNIAGLTGNYTLPAGNITGTVTGLLGTDTIKIYGDDPGSNGSNGVTNTNTYTLNDTTASSYFYSTIPKQWRVNKIEWTNKPAGWGADYIFNIPPAVNVNTGSPSSVNLNNTNITWPPVSLTSAFLTPIGDGRLRITNGYNFHPDKTQYTVQYPGLTGGTVNGSVLDVPGSTQMDVNIPKGIMDSANLTLTLAGQLGITKTYDLWVNPITTGNKSISNNSGNSSNNDYPDIVIGPNGNLHLVWADDTLGNNEIMYRKSTDGGVTWVNPVVVGNGSISNNSQGSWSPNLAVGGDGTLHVVWSDNTPGNYEIMYRKSTDGGITWTNPITAGNGTISNLSGSSGYPKIIIGGDGTLHVVWDDDKSGNDEIMYKKSTDGGITWINPVTAGNNTISNTANASFMPDIRIGSDASFYVIWEDGTALNRDIMCKKSTDGGVTWINPVIGGNNTISNTPGSFSHNPQIESQNNILYAIWEDNVLTNWEIMYRKSTDGGITWTNPVIGGNNTISSTSGDSNISQIAISGDGNIHVVWMDNLSGNKEIMYKRSIDSGITWTNPITTGNGTISNNSGVSTWLQMIIGGNGILYVVWADNTPGNYEIMYKQRRN